VHIQIKIYSIKNFNYSHRERTIKTRHCSYKGKNWQHCQHKFITKWGFGKAIV
jgi:hypothetical protein